MIGLKEYIYRLERAIIRTVNEFGFKLPHDLMEEQVCGLIRKFPGKPGKSVQSESKQAGI